MKDWLRRLRGALGIGVTWALGWAPIGAVLGSVLWFLLDVPVGLLAVIQINAIAFGILGFLGGTIFSTVLGLAEGRRQFDELTLPRFAAWGALGGLLLGGLAVGAGLWGASGVPVVAATVTVAATLLGAASAVGSLALARHADGDTALEPAADRSSVGPGGTDGRQLIGGSR
jgi:hypothetical protein